MKEISRSGEASCRRVPSRPARAMRRLLLRWRAQPYDPPYWCGARRAAPVVSPATMLARPRPGQLLHRVGEPTIEENAVRRYGRALPVRLIAGRSSSAFAQPARSARKLDRSSRELTASIALPPARAGWV